MARYFVQATHTPEQCIQNLEEILEQDPERLEMWDFACAAGSHSNHTSYATIEAQNENEARNFVPSYGRSNAQITEVAKQTPDQVRAAHEQAA